MLSRRENKGKIKAVYFTEEGGIVDFLWNRSVFTRGIHCLRTQRETILCGETSERQGSFNLGSS